MKNALVTGSVFYFTLFLIFSTKLSAGLNAGIVCFGKFCKIRFKTDSHSVLKQTPFSSTHNCKMPAFYGSNVSIETVNELSVDQLSVNGLQEELRVKLSFFQEHKKSEIKPVTKIETVKPLAELSENGLFLPMNDKQKDFLTELYIKSECITFNITQEDIDEWDSKNEDNDDNNDDEFNTRPEIHDERIEIYHREKQEPGYLLKRLTESLVSTFIFSSICELNDESKKHNSTQRYYYLREEYEKLATKNK